MISDEQLLCDALHILSRISLIPTLFVACHEKLILKSSLLLYICKKNNSNFKNLY